MCCVHRQQAEAHGIPLFEHQDNCRRKPQLLGRQYRFAPGTAQLTLLKLPVCIPLPTLTDCKPIVVSTSKFTIPQQHASLLNR